ncbi:hypothetical protein A2715_04860 [Candidatus Woesebacteria bacterium RIFCSPHIGHO2_01_FULL_39_32]|uniref:Glycosyltransferase RgtA/B/C/D-like domain-containing protein n=1 Tax=Candidatus Woesebacteria bacterium RIFCSPLOWO2_01_FULL_39_25 TaxID=1802521 RepID=A0A1F8BLN8_9BACT|nr:MAG: hypothetical protein A2124_00855 [Candidatus Woesebacteria bacterium GWB1_37_5]OGM25349.1 MAG: hypothetical protein A2715_04860 [Candidatus Woesebacteria bacterium RIFCSPHIGHO2_01_FULL_39_32]OGM37848.1 MAG: hypothetical protein A3F01_02070 [Candidatus Woesebacteria bacterium RIFCSPHIGHO2_12_FULL_38_11]OGM64880.1 MAG: hypothetical protein A2893_04470 [Candidatus Woesebacteria bacterium RIFCSPLOWO2_01_FULL_39_25]
MGIKKILTMIIAWRILLLVFLFLAIQILPLQLNFLGGGLENYLEKPFFWGWANYDGEHYIYIARNGYTPLTYFYFPLYPLTIRYLVNLTDGSFLSYLYSGLFVSHIAFLSGLIGLIRVIRIDYDERIVWSTLTLLLVFPTSFYFGSVYTESLFFALSIWSFYFARKGKWVLAGVLGALLTATRLVGIALFPALIVEALQQWKEDKVNLRLAFASSFAVLLGLIFHAFVLNSRTGDPLNFLHSVGIFGPQRARAFINLAQVFYRYIFKIIPNIDYSYFPTMFTTWMEFLVAILFGGLGVLGIFGGLALRLRSGSSRSLILPKIRPSYVVYLVIGYIIPTLSGSFSSLPRYVLVLFPGFILGALLIAKLPKIIQTGIILGSFILLALATMLFVRGYWVS